MADLQNSDTLQTATCSPCVLNPGSIPKQQPKLLYIPITGGGSITARCPLLVANWIKVPSLLKRLP